MRLIRDQILSVYDMHYTKDMIMIFIITHGREGGVLEPRRIKAADGKFVPDGDGNGWDIPDIIDVLCENGALTDKPKILWPVACRGDTSKFHCLI